MPKDPSEVFRQEIRRGQILLGILAATQRETYGFALQKTLKDEGLAIDEPTLYPVLRRLEARGYLRSEWRIEENRPRRFYRLTGQGRHLLEEMLEYAHTISDVVDNVYKKNREAHDADN